MNKVEKRFFNTELRASQGDEGSLVVSGRAATYSRAGSPEGLSENLGGFRERIGVGAFTSSLRKGQDVILNLNHDDRFILARRSVSSLRISEDSKGLQFNANLDPAVSYARDCHQNISNGNLSEMSFAFTVDPDGDEWGYEDDPETGERIGVRTLKSVTLHDVAIVASPAYSNGATSVQAGHDYNPSTMPFPRNLPASMPLEMRSKILERASHTSSKKQSDECTAEIQSLTVRAEVLARGSRSEQAQSSVLLAQAANLRASGLSSKEITARNKPSKYTRQFRDYMTGKITAQEYRDFIAGTESLTYTLGPAGGFSVPVSFYNEVTEALSQTDPFLDENVVTLIRNKALVANPISIVGWDLSAIASVQVGEGSQQTPQTVPAVSNDGRLLGGYMHRVSLAASIEWEQDAFELAMKLMARAYAVAFARGIGKQLVNGSGVGQPQGLLTGAANSGITTVTPSSAGVTPLKYNDFSAIFGSVDRIYRQSPKAAWVVNDVTYQQIRNAVDNSGRPLLDMREDREELFGKPVLISPSMPSGPGSQGILFGDLSHFMVRLSAMTIQRSMQVGGIAGNIERGEATYHGRMRADSAVFDPSTPHGSPAVSSVPIVYATLHS